MTLRIVSGGQTGVDRAALDVALALGLDRGGWCPQGRRAEDGVIPACYPLTETTSRDYAARTAANIRDSDATLIVHLGSIDGGTALTRRLAREIGRPCHAVDPRDADAELATRRWLAATRPACLNVAGPRASKEADGYARAYAFLARVLGPA